jgi:ADP-ribosyl-[dinitrogen reductase] hydrolase
VIDNFDLLQKFISSGQIALKNAPFLSHTPPALPADLDWRRLEGMFLGLAVGDALGNTSESMLPGERLQRYGEIRDYLPNWYAGTRNVGLPTDDTQMAFWTLEQLIEDGGLIPEHLASKFTQHQIFGIGSTVMNFLQSYKYQAVPWIQAGQPSAGNGALMRIAPVIIPHLRNPSPALWADAALAGMVTHNDRASNACCVAFTHTLWECLRLGHAPEPMWWLERFVSAASQLEGDSTYAPRNNRLVHRGPLWQFVDREVTQAINENWSVLEACNRWYSGAYLLETMPCVLYILARYGNDPEEAIVRAVNDTRDNDTIAAIVGAAVGALHSRDAIPQRWISGLLGRLGKDDDGRIFELLAQADQAFW